MVRASSLLLALSLSLSLAGIPFAVAGEKWECTKDGTALKVEGKNAKDKKKHCEKKGGVWEKSKAHSHEQSSGSGGSW